MRPIPQLSHRGWLTAAHSGFGDLNGFLKIAIQSLTCLMTSKHRDELSDMKTFTPPSGRMGCLLSRIWTSPVPNQAFASHSCMKLSFPKCVSPPERCHWGLLDTSKGLTSFLTNWPLHSFQEVSLWFLCMFE